MGLRISGPYNSGAAAGGDGVATNNATSAIKLTGLVYGFYIEYNGSPPAGTTDVVITTSGNQNPADAVTLLSVENAATDGWFLVRQATVSAANAANTADYEPIPLDDNINVKIDGANAADNVDVWLALIE
jgi:hypothetical protein